MVNKVLLLGIGASLALGSANLQAWGLGNLTNPLTSSSSSGGDVGTQVATFQTSAGVADGLVANSSVYLLQAVVSKARGAELQKQLDTINQMTDPKEKNAAMADLVKSSSAELATAEKSKQTQADLNKASAEKKASIAKGLFNLALGLLQVNDLTKSGNSIVNGVAQNPMELLKAVPVKDTLPVLGSLATNGKSVLDSGLNLAKAADIKVELPTSATAKPEALDSM